MINRVILVGNLGRDPEVRTLESGAKVAKFSLATTERYQDKNGEWQDMTEWHNIVAWRNRAEQAERSFKKGALVYVEGKLTHRKYQDANGQDRYITEVVANYMRLLRQPGDGSGSSSGYFPGPEDEVKAGGPPAVEDAGAAEPPASEGEDDLPF